uniref:Metallo-beta-lactamase domain-containing protein n=1 Tax=Panagrolaimus davidi TaxID=227884 RepID=A0A914QX63_9BILA
MEEENVPPNEFAKPDFINGRFSNPKSFSTWKGLPSFYDLIKWKLFERKESLLPSNEEIEKALPLIIPKFDLQSNLSATWLGHATVFVHLEDINIITDPVFAERVSPSKYFGPKRYRNTPCKVEDLPEINIGVISHNHYDHLDSEAVKQISKNNPKMCWFVPLGLKQFMDKISNGTSVNEKTCQRSAFDRNKTLWSGWAILGSNHKFFYPGDTGFCEDEFKKLGEKYGPFQFSALPIGCYHDIPSWVPQSQHINPKEAVKIHKLIKSEYSMGIHWGTYALAPGEFYLEPRDLLIKAAEHLPQNEVFTVKHGETWKYPQKKI